MSDWTKVVTNPMGLVGFALFLAFGLVARVKRQDERRWLFPLAIVMAAIALLGGLGLAYLQVMKQSTLSASQANRMPAFPQQQNNQVNQTTTGPGSPTVQDVKGNVTITVDQSSGKIEIPKAQGQNLQHAPPKGRPTAGGRTDTPAPTPPKIEINAPSGIAIGGGTVVNPTVNNYGAQTKPDRTIGEPDRTEIVRYLSEMKGTIGLSAPSGDREATNYAVLWYAIFKDAGWQMKDRIVLAYLTVGGNPTPGAILHVRGEPAKQGEQITVLAADPLARVANALKSQSVPILLQRDPNQEDGLIVIQFGPRPD
jgi:hypothetical protein